MYNTNLKERLQPGRQVAKYIVRLSWSRSPHVIRAQRSISTLIPSPKYDLNHLTLARQKLALQKISEVMKKNMGTADRVIRTMAAVVIALLYYFNVIQGTFGIVLLVLAGVFLLTSFVSFCPLYAPFGWSTCALEKK